MLSICILMFIPHVSTKTALIVTASLGVHLCILQFRHGFSLKPHSAASWTLGLVALTVAKYNSERRARLLFSTATRKLSATEAGMFNSDQVAEMICRVWLSLPRALHVNRPFQIWKDYRFYRWPGQL
eukprot:Gregarina_sp_Poly_1__3384@NODE_1977_length_2944_cov_24_061522_g1273_i0_p2_GENE_NODE_1977_length_2944_cov_24_061522_g1273_i0NODE_1977_length_2944_cov_24_061522_g1273_i0_p2_ORF_typecomplete_len127_score0_15_NODE_1977_length_2944_cov_24_061522_g1273_i0476856